MKVAISATLFAAYFVYVHAAPVAPSGEQLKARGVSEKPPVFSPSKWSHVDSREAPPVFPTYVWSTARDVTEEVPTMPGLPDSFTHWTARSKHETTIYSLLPLSVQARIGAGSPDGTPVEKREVPPPLFDEWRNDLKEVEKRMIPPNTGGEPFWEWRFSLPYGKVANTQGTSDAKEESRSDAKAKREVEGNPPPLFSEGGWARSIDERSESKRGVESDTTKKASPELAPLWLLGLKDDLGMTPDWSKRDVEGVAYPQDAPIWTTAWGINPREAAKRDTKGVAYPQEAPVWTAAWGLIPGIPDRTASPEVKKRHDASSTEVPPPFNGEIGWRLRNPTTKEKREVPPPFNGEIGWRLRNPTGQQADVAGRELPPPFDFREWEWASKRLEEAEAREVVEKRELPPPFDFREWNWAGKRLAEAEAKAAAAKRMIPPPTGSEFNLFTGGNGWPSPRAEKRMIPPPTGSEFNLFSGGGGWPSPRAEEN